MSSLVAFQGVPRAANYAATKACVQSFAEALRLAQTPKDVAGPTLGALGRRGTVRPGWLSRVLEAALAFLPRRGRVHMIDVVSAD